MFCRILLAAGVLAARVAAEEAFSCEEGLFPFDVYMLDSWGDGWNGNAFTMSPGPESGLSYDPVTDTLHSGEQGLMNTCLPSGCHHMRVNDGEWQQEVSWWIMAYGNHKHNFTGGCPWDDLFYINDQGHVSASCPCPDDKPHTITFHLTDAYGDGWNGNRFDVVDTETGVEVVNMTMSGGSYLPKDICMADGCYDMSVTKKGTYFYEVAWYLGCTADGCLFNGTAGSMINFGIVGGEVSEFCGPSPTPRPTYTFAPTHSPTTSKPSVTPTPAPSPSPTTAMPSVTPTPKPTPSPTVSPTPEPTPSSDAPTSEPTFNPTPRPSPMPTTSLYSASVEVAVEGISVAQAEAAEDTFIDAFHTSLGGDVPKENILVAFSEAEPERRRLTGGIIATFTIFAPTVEAAEVLTAEAAAITPTDFEANVQAAASANSVSLPPITAAEPVATIVTPEPTMGAVSSGAAPLSLLFGLLVAVAAVVAF